MSSLARAAIAIRDWANIFVYPSIERCLLHTRRVCAAPLSLLSAHPRWAVCRETEQPQLILIVTITVVALLSNLLVILPALDSSALALLFLLLLLPVAFATFCFLLLTRGIDPGFLQPASEPPSPSTLQLLRAHRSQLLPPTRKVRVLTHQDGSGTRSSLPLLHGEEQQQQDSDTDDDDGDDAESELEEWCALCGIWRPLRAGHCSVCDLCVLRYDHHCVAIGACIGQHNLLFFLLFLLCSALAGCVLTASCCLLLLQLVSSPSASYSSPLLYLTFVLCCSSVYIACTGLCFLHHCRLAHAGVTMRERYGRRARAGLQQQQAREKQGTRLSMLWIDAKASRWKADWQLSGRQHRQDAVMQRLQRQSEWEQSWREEDKQRQSADEDADNGDDQLSKTEEKEAAASESLSSFLTAAK